MRSILPLSARLMMPRMGAPRGDEADVCAKDGPGIRLSMNLPQIQSSHRLLLPSVEALNLWECLQFIVPMLQLPGSGVLFTSSAAIFRQALTVVLLLFLMLLALAGQAQTPVADPAGSAAAYSISERGPHHRRWQKVTEVLRPDGTTAYRTNSYVELATGMYFWKDGAWADTQEIIEIVDGRRAARFTSFTDFVL